MTSSKHTNLHYQQSPPQQNLPPNYCPPSNLGFMCMVCSRKIESSTFGAALPQLPSDGVLPSSLPLICGACKKFYWRNRRTNAKNIEKCTCSRQNNDASTSTSAWSPVEAVAFCRACRFARCEVAIMRQQAEFAFDQQLAVGPESFANPSSSTSEGNNGRRTSLRLVPCQVCGASSSGYHFGIISCEGCKGFFRRSLTKFQDYKCTIESASQIHSHDRKKCKFCRYMACIAAGMSNTTIRTGRHSIQRRIQTSLFVKKLAAENRLLSNQTPRRRRRRRFNSIDAHYFSVRNSSEGDPTSVKRFSGSSSVQTFETMEVKPNLSELEFRLQQQQSSRRPSLQNMVQFMGELEQNQRLSPPINVDELINCRISDEPFKLDIVVRDSIQALKFMQPLVEMTCPPLNRNKSLADIWQSYMSTCFEPQLSHVLNFVRAMPGFSDLAVPDRIKLFSYAYFPILVAQLAMTYNETTGNVSFFCLADEQSAELLKPFFADYLEICHRQLLDAGQGLRALNPTSAEFAVLCALLFFNPNVPGLADPEKVRLMRQVYVHVDRQVNNFNRPLLHYRRFSSLAGYFQPMVRLFAQTISNVERLNPELLLRHSLFSEIYSNVSSLIYS